MASIGTPFDKEKPKGQSNYTSCVPSPYPSLFVSMPGYVWCGGGGAYVVWVKRRCNLRRRAMGHRGQAPAISWTCFEVAKVVCRQSVVQTAAPTLGFINHGAYENPKLGLRAPFTSDLEHNSRFLVGRLTCPNLAGNRTRNLCAARQ